MLYKFFFNFFFFFFFAFEVGPRHIKMMWLGRSTLGGVAIANEGFLLTKRSFGLLGVWGRMSRRAKDAGREIIDSERRSKDDLFRSSRRSKRS